MIYYVFFWAMCAVLAAHFMVAIIAIAKAYRDERRLALSRTPRRVQILG
jgi:hypothetical protein